MPPRPSHKRAAESRAEGAEGASKKTRFVEPDEDPTRFADAVDAELEDVPGRRGRVRTEGYESDSSDEGEGVVRSRQPGAGTSAAAAGDDDDMFALADADAAAPGAPGADAKKDEFLRLGDIEGQEFHDDGARDAAGAESDVSEEPEDEDDAARRAKAGMGFELSGFNMRDEMEEGKFTADGAYVRSRDEHAAHDRWLDGIADKEMRRARRSKKARERAEEERQRAEERELQDIGGKIQLERDLLAMLKRGETVLEALQRLGALAKKAQKLDKGKGKRDPKAAAMDVDPANKSFSPIEHVTHIASMLMSVGDTEVYSRTYEELVRSVRASGVVPPEWEPPSADVRYEYKWAVPDSTAPGQVFGPYGEDDMKAWHKAAYFGPDAEKVQVRVLDGEWGAWNDVVI